MELCGLLASPEYEAVIVEVPETDGVYVTSQEPDDNVQVDEGLNLAPVSFDENVTVPVGELPMTVVVQVTDAPMSIVRAEQDIVTLGTGASRARTLSESLPELPTLSGSPE